MAVELAQQQAAGAVVDAAQKPGVVADYIDDIVIKTWAENDWTLMLSAAPVCLELLGLCCLVASTEVARTTTLTPPAGGFKHLKGYKYLTACLVEVSNKGNTSFMLARTNMASIGERSKSVKDSVKSIFKDLRAQEFSQQFDDTVISTEMKRLKTAANKCAEDAKAMDMEFTSWMSFIMELHEACQDQESRDTELFVDILSKEKYQAVYQAEQENILKEHKERVTLMEDKVKEAHELYKGLQDKFPTGKDLMMQQLIMIGAEAAASLIKIAGAAAAAYVSPASAFTSGAEALKGASDKGNSGSKSSKEDEDDDKEKKTDKDGKKAAADPALARCPFVLIGLETLNDILEDGVDWDRVTGAVADDKGAKNKGKMDLVGVKEILSKVQKNINKADDEKKSSGGKKLLKILKETMTVVNEMCDERKKSQDAKKWTKPADGSKIVKAWEATVEKSLNATLKLQAKSKGSSTGSAGRPPLVIKAPKASKEEVQARTDLTKATIENAKAQLKIALDAYVAQQETAYKMNEQTIKLQQDLATVRREISELGQQKITLEEVRRVLRDCIAYLVQLKEQVRKLMLFFTTVSRLLDNAMSSHVTPFMELVASAEDQRTNGHFVRRQVMQHIMEYTLNVAASFSLYQEISDMYREVNDQHIEPGLGIVDRMGSQTAAGELEAKKQQLAEYSKSASEGIGAIIKRKTEKVCAGSKKRAEDLKAILAHPDLPPSTRPEKAAAIQQGIAQSTSAIQAAIEYEQKPLQYLTQSKETRDARSQELANATSTKFREEQAQRQREESAIDDDTDSDLNY